MEMNDNGKFFSNTNPIRYRGYYYDTETDINISSPDTMTPSICRLINFDVPKITGT